MGGDSGLDVVARYGNWYEGDDDLFCHCLILRNGQLLWLTQGLQAVTVRQGTASAKALSALIAALDRLPKGWLKSNYAGYNFITDAEGREADEIAVLGVQEGDSTKSLRYYAAQPGSEIARQVKEIAGIDAP
ncbi:MAG: hypothetical protein HY077_11420 [Elusimicrobia bacterium]|nr:hypothetical protein [Elusimicrobiota bacterium]